MVCDECSPVRLAARLSCRLLGRSLALVAVLAAGCDRQPPSAPVAGGTAVRPADADAGAGAGAPEAAKSAAATKENASAQPGNTPDAAKPVPPVMFTEWPRPVVALVVTGQQLGYIEPCGCTGLESQKGGLARRHTLLRELRDERGWTIVPLDVGSQVKRFGKQQEVKFASTVQGLRTMGYRGVALGEGDLRLTPGELLAAIAGPDGTVSDFVGSNVAVLARELEPEFLVLEAAGKRLGITAVLGEKYEHRLQGDELIHRPPLDGLRAAAKELEAKKCDYYVLLAHTPLDEARRLAEQVPLFDLVVASGETAVPTYELETVGTKTRLMQVGQKAMHAGVIGLFDDKQTPLRYQSVPLDARYADSPEMLQLLADYQQKLKDSGLEGLGIRAQPHPSGRMFVGSEKCGDCHTKAYATWSNTPHAHATDSLVHPPNSRGAIARHFDPECLSCHVTGWEPQQHFPYESGYVSLEQTPQLQHNGCENCHGPGSAHVAAESGEGNLAAGEIAKLREGMKLPLAGPAAERKCLECHDLDNSHDFHHPGGFERYWQKVEHRGKD